MPLKVFTTVPKDIIQWSKWASSLVVKPDPNTITNETFANRAPNSIIGRSAGTAGVPGDIVAAADGQFLLRRLGAVTFDGIQDSDIPSGIARDSEVAAADAVVTAAAATALAAHVAAADPHPVYTTAAELATTLTAYDARAVADTRNVLASSVLSGSTTYDPPSLADAAGTTTTVTVTGAALGDFALASFSLSLQGLMQSAEVTATDTVTVSLFNKTGGTLDIASGTLKARVWK